MVLDQSVFDILRDRYQVYNVETRIGTYGAMNFTDSSEVTMELSMSGFNRLVNDLFSPNKNVVDTRDVFTIVPMEIKDKRQAIYIAKYKMDKYPLGIISEYGKKLHELFESEGRALILMPEFIDVSVLSTEQLTQMRDNLTALIESLSYDNIIGF